MRNSILGTVAGLIIGTAGALAYSHYLGDGGRLADLQAQLDAANAKLQKSEADKKLLAQQNNDESDQVNQLVASNEALKKQVANPGDAPTASAAPAPTPSLFDPNLMNGIIAAMRGGRGGFRSPEQRMLLLQKRLNLTSDQQAKIKAAMDADQQARRDLFRQARQNGTPPDPQALAAANTLDKTLTSVLSQYQQSQYQQLQSDEKAARAESSATSQVDDIMPLLQLTDDQKEKALNALYQQQLSAPDPMTLMGNPNAVATLAAQGQSMQAALKQVLNPDQYALYQQSQQVTAQAWANGPGGGRRGNNNGGNGNGGATNAAPGAQTTSTVAAATPTPAPATAAATTTDTTSATNAASATTNAPSTNAPASAPAN
jgi:Spy/CpxP family protein refolding chaperone